MAMMQDRKTKVPAASETAEVHYEERRGFCVREAGPSDWGSGNKQGLRKKLLQEIDVIINLIMMADKAKLGNVWSGEFEYDAIVEVNAKAPNLARFWMKFLGAQDRVKRVLLKKLGLLRGLALNLFIEGFEETVKGLGCNNLHYSPMSSNKLFLLVIRPAR